MRAIAVRLRPATSCGTMELMTTLTVSRELWN
jgi:hypothetical protein